ncbi:MAG TPA: NlpC/P60 family protein, partial [Steroidobacteraceae bacterium]|nr:NlpC/P60 family protein [Steroidobacteraceae bacterium]
RVDERELRPGDLVFFRLESRRRDVSHVGIYTGQRRFVHAPQSGRDVSEASLDEPYYRERYAGAGRFYDAEGGGRGPRLKSPP